MSIQGAAERVDDTTHQGIADADVHDAAGTFDFVSGVQVGIVTEKHDTDFIRIDIEGDAEQIAGKFDQFLKSDAGQSGYHGDPGGDRGNSSDFTRSELMLVSVEYLADTGKSAFGTAQQGIGQRTHVGRPTTISGVPGAGVVTAGATGSLLASATGSVFPSFLAADSSKLFMRLASELK